MRTLLFILAFIAASSLFAAEETATITTFTVKEGRTIEAVRYAAAGDEGSKVFMITTVDGERIKINEADVVSRGEKKVLLSELSEKARAQIQAVKTGNANAKANAREEDAARESAKKDIAVTVRNDIEARSVLRKADDELKEANRTLAHLKQLIADTNVAIAAADAEYDGAKAELSNVNDNIRRRGDRETERELQARREARRDQLNKKMKNAAEEKTKLNQRKTEAEKRVGDTNDEIKKLTEKRQIAQKQADYTAAEKSKAIVAANNPTTTKKADPTGDTTVLRVIKLKDGTVVRAKSVIVQDGGILQVTDENGVERRIDPKDVETGI